MDGGILDGLDDVGVGAALSEFLLARSRLACALHGPGDQGAVANPAGVPEVSREVRRAIDLVSGCIFGALSGGLVDFSEENIARWALGRVRPIVALLGREPAGGVPIGGFRG